MERSIERIDSAPAHMAGFSSRTDYLLTQQEAEDRKYAETHKDLMAAIGKGDANAVCNFAPTVDWTRTKSPVSTEAGYVYRAMTLAEILDESLDMRNAPGTTELMQVVMNASRSTDAVLSAQATDLLDKLAAAWANNMTGEVA